MDPAAFYGASGDLDARLRAALAKLSLVARQALGRRAGADSLSATQSIVLAHLLRRGQTQVGELAAQLGLTAPTVSDSVAALERRGLVSRRPVQGDARRVEVALTRRGHEVARSQAHWSDVFREAVEDLAPEEKAVALRLLLRVIARLVERGVVRDARTCVTCTHLQPYAHPGQVRPHHCALVDLPLSEEHWRVDCPDHLQLRRTPLRRRLRVLQAGAR